MTVEHLNESVDLGDPKTPIENVDSVVPQPDQINRAYLVDYQNQKTFIGRFKGNFHQAALKALTSTINKNKSYGSLSNSNNYEIEIVNGATSQLFAYIITRLKICDDI